MAFNKKLFPHIVLLRLAAFIVVMLYNSYKIYQGLLIAAEENGSLFLLIVLSEKTTLSRQDLSFQFVFPRGNKPWLKSITQSFPVFLF